MSSCEERNLIILKQLFGIDFTCIKVKKFGHFETMSWDCFPITIFFARFETMSSF